MPEGFVPVNEVIPDLDVELERRPMEEGEEVNTSAEEAEAPTSETEAELNEDVAEETESDEQDAGDDVQSEETVSTFEDETEEEEEK